MDVRCCCNPGKLLGTIPDGLVPTREGIYEITTQEGKVVVEVGRLYRQILSKDRYRKDEYGNSYLPAIKSNDLPVEYYARIPGWKPAIGEKK